LVVWWLGKYECGDYLVVGVCGLVEEWGGGGSCSVCLLRARECVCICVGEYVGGCARGLV